MSESEQGKDGEATAENEPGASSGGGNENFDENDPRNPSDQNQEHSAKARGAEVELSPEEKEEGIKSAAPDGGEIQEVPDDAAAEDMADKKQEGERRGQADGESGSEGESRSRVSVVDEQPPRPDAPSGSSDEEYKWHTYRVYPSGRPDAVEFIDTYKAFGRSHILEGLNMGLPEGMVSMILGPVGYRQIGLHQAHGRSALSR